MDRNFDEESKDNSGRKYQYNIDTIVRKMFLERVKSFFHSNNWNNTLEIGSYDGSMTEQLLDFFPKINVVEPSSQLAVLVDTRMKGRVNVFNMKFEELDLNMKFDNVFLVHTLEHLDDPISVLKKIQSMLSAQGRGFIMVPNANALSRKIACKMGMLKKVTDVLESEKLQGHLRTYSLASLEQTILQAGLTVHRSGGILFKTLANFQIDLALETGVISIDYLKACNSLSIEYPEFSSSIYAIVS